MTTRAQGVRRSAATLAGATLLIVGSSCSGGGDVRVEQVERQVQLDPDGRVVDSSASATTFIETQAEPTSTTAAPQIQPLTDSLAADGTAAVDCGGGARTVKLSEGRSSTELADGSTAQIVRVGTARLDDYDDDGLDDLVAAYRCSESDEPVAMSLSFWHAEPQGPTRSAVSVDPIEPDWTVVIPNGPGDRRVGLSVLAPDDVALQVTTTVPDAGTTADDGDGGTATEPNPVAQPLQLPPRLIPEGQQTVRQVLAIIDSGRLRLVSDAPPKAGDGVESLPITTFPDRLDLTATGLGPLRIGATEGQLTEALALVATQVQYPAIPPCFGEVDRVLQVGPIYFGMTQSKLRAIWVTGPALTTTERTVALSAKPAGDEPSLTVGEAVDAANPPDGLKVLGFGEDWVGLGSTTPRSTVSVAAEADAPGAAGRNVTGFGLAERVCLSGDFGAAAG